MSHFIGSIKEKKKTNGLARTPLHKTKNSSSNKNFNETQQSSYFGAHPTYIDTYIHTAIVRSVNNKQAYPSHHPLTSAH